MRIIAGTARGRSLKTLPGDATRPTSGKVRGALFSMLSAWVPEAAWLDLFAGSGAIGFEAASRGAKRVVLVERASEARRVIEDNLAALKLEGITLWPTEVDAALRSMAGQRFDVVFMDPPYATDPLPTITAIAEAGLLVADGRLVVEHRANRELPDQVAGLTRLQTRSYSDSCLTIYAPMPAG